MDALHAGNIFSAGCIYKRKVLEKVSCYLNNVTVRLIPVIRCIAAGRNNCGMVKE